MLLYLLPQMLTAATTANYPNLPSLLLLRPLRRNHNRQTLKHHPIPLIMRHKTSLQNPPQPFQPHQLPPFIDPHYAIPMDPHRHPAPVALARLVADGVLVPRPARRVLDAVEDVRKVGVQGLLVFLGERARVQLREIGEGVQQLVGAAVGVVALDELGGAGRGVRVLGEVFVAVGEDFVVLGRGVGFFVEEGDVFAGGDLHSRIAAAELFDKGLHGVFGLGGEVFDKSGEEAPFFESGDNRTGLVGGGDEVAVRGDDFEEVGHVFQYFVFRCATVEGTATERVDRS